MKKLNAQKLRALFENEFGSIRSRRFTLYIILGVLGDFDSFEYIQALISKLKQLKTNEVDLFIIGIGDSNSKSNFCRYTKLPEEFLKVVETNSIHNQLDLNRGLQLTNSPFVNLMLMCMGINSPGTLLEVLRGYTGDKSAKQLFTSDEKIFFCKHLSFEARLFKVLGGEGFMRPFELASLRLMNMSEIISNWNIYMKNSLYVTQRGGTFLVDSKNEIIYSYYSNALLGFSETLRNPIQFLYNNGIISDKF